MTTYQPATEGKRLKVGTKITVRGWAMDGTEVQYPATIKRNLPHNSPLPSGYQPVRFADTGGCQLVHRESMTVVDDGEVEMVRHFKQLLAA